MERSEEQSPDLIIIIGHELLGVTVLTNNGTTKVGVLATFRVWREIQKAIMRR